MTFASHDGEFFWSNGHAWGRCALRPQGSTYEARLEVLHGELNLRRFILQNFGETTSPTPLRLQAGESRSFEVKVNLEKPAFSDGFMQKAFKNSK